MRKDVPIEVSCVIRPVAREIADAFAAEASGSACCNEVDYGFVQLVREQEAAEDCRRVSHLKAATMRSDLDEQVCCSDSCTMLLV